MITRDRVSTPDHSRTTATRPTAGVRRLLVVLGALAGLLLAAAVPASAHAALLTSDPADGAVLEAAPTQILLTFSEGVLLSDDSLRVLDPEGRRVDKDGARHTGAGGATAAVPLTAGLPDGTFTVAWKAVSADSHPIGGAFTFSIGAPSRTTVVLDEQTAGGGAVGTLYGVGRYAAYAGYALLVGSAVFLALCWPRGAGIRRLQRIAVGGWAALAVSTVAMLLLRGSYANGAGFGDVGDLGVLRDVLDTRPGAALLSRLLLLAAAAVFLSVLFGAYARREDPAERADLAWGLGIGGGVVATGLAATWVMAEHASTGIQTGLAMPVAALHLVAMAVWLGGLVTLLAALLGGRDIEREAVRRFSRIGFGAVVTLVATGVYQSWRQLGSWDALVSTSYGQLLLVKIGLVLVLVCAAGASRRWTARLGEVAVSVTGPRPGKRVRSRRDVPVASPRAEDPAVPAAGTDGGSGAGPADPVRVSQLERQRSAIAAARARRVRDADPGRTGLRRSVLVETLVAVALLAVTTVLTGTEPGRTAEAAGPVVPGAGALPVGVGIPYDTGGPKGAGNAEVTLDPGRVGDNDLHLLTVGRDGRPVDPPEVKVSFTLGSQDIGPLTVDLEKIDTGHWSAAGVRIPMAGEWELSVTVRTSDIDQVTETRNVKID